MELFDEEELAKLNKALADKVQKILDAHPGVFYFSGYSPQDGDTPYRVDLDANVEFLCPPGYFVSVDVYDECVLYNHLPLEDNKDGLPVHYQVTPEQLKSNVDRFAIAGTQIDILDLEPPPY